MNRVELLQMAQAELDRQNQFRCRLLVSCQYSMYFFRSTGS